VNTEKLEIQASVDPQLGNVDPLYLFACHVEWERRSEPSAAWELIAAAETGDSDTRAQARALLANSHKVPAAPSCNPVKSKRSAVEANMKVPYGLEIIESCADCTRCKPGFFCAFSEVVAKAVDLSSHRSTLPPGAILFVEGQMPRGLFVLCSGKVKLSSTSREGKVLILKTAEAGEALGLSAAISGQSYEMTAETATPCHVNFVDRRSLLSLLQSHSEVGMHAAQSLSLEFQSAYRDMHDLVLARSSSGKLARLLLSFSKAQFSNTEEARLRSIMTHEEMAQRIGSSRETVTRLLSDLKRKRLIRLDGATLVIQNRTALEALAV
jgi:CRP/FNR family transcriptional regulator